MLYSYTTVRYGKYSALLTFSAIIMVVFLSSVFLEADPKEAFQLVWILLAVVAFMLYSYLSNQFTVQDRLREGEKKRILTFTVVGFVAVVMMMFGLMAVTQVTSRYTSLLFPAFGMLSPGTLLKVYVSIAAIFEENLRFAASRFLEQWEISFPFLPVGRMVHRIYVTILVNLIWATYHIRSYVGANFAVWMGLFMAGIIISVMMNLSGNVLVAVLIHLLWNLMVVL